MVETTTSETTAAAAQVEEQKKPAKAKAEPTVDLVTKYKRRDVEDLMKRKFFTVPSFEIYGGVAGFFDYGPLGCAVKNNIEQLWRQHFVLEEDMLEIGCTNLMLGEVLKASGHVDKFEDLMVKDMKTGTPRRADKLIQEFIGKKLQKCKKPDEREEYLQLEADVENFSAEQIDAVITRMNIKDPDTGNALSPAVPFNLMFDTQIGPTGLFKGYLRPETAQGIFINFRRLLEFNNGRLPFASAQIGLGFRNEISPRQGLLRVREFTMAEVEHFYDPQDRDHPKFSSIADVELPLFSSIAQEAGEREPVMMRIGEAVGSGLVSNQTVGYFLARTYNFLCGLGIRSEAIRFRQHRSNEMAHYANDCWDAEVETSYGWIEIAGHADRSAFDLSKHMQKTKTELMAARRLPEAITVTQTMPILNKKIIGKQFKKDQKQVVDYFEQADEQTKANLAQAITEQETITITSEDGKEFVLTREMISFKTQTKQTQEEKFVPHVIEPSFGIGRIIYCVFEHCFRMREEDAQRVYFAFPPSVAPVKTSLLPLVSNSPEFKAKIQELKKALVRAGISSKVDDSTQTVGKRYARTDECGIPFAVTVDNRTMDDNTVTLRELHTMKQIRLSCEEMVSLLKDLVADFTTWEAAVERYGVYIHTEVDLAE